MELASRMFATVSQQLFDRILTKFDITRYLGWPVAYYTDCTVKPVFKATCAEQQGQTGN